MLSREGRVVILPREPWGARPAGAGASGRARGCGRRHPLGGLGSFPWMINLVFVSVVRFACSFGGSTPAAKAACVRLCPSKYRWAHYRQNIALRPPLFAKSPQTSTIGSGENLNTCSKGRPTSPLREPNGSGPHNFCATRAVSACMPSTMATGWKRAYFKAASFFRTSSLTHTRFQQCPVQSLFVTWTP